MRPTIQISLIVTFLLTGCVHDRHAQLPAPVVGKPIATETDAVAVVLADIQSRGGDPGREECSAKKMDGEWYVTAWHVWYPHHKGSSRFVPGGFTTYVVSTEGRILRTMPGE